MALSEILRDFPRQALHAMELHFIHPRSKKPMKFKSGLPEDIKGLLSHLAENS